MGKSILTLQLIAALSSGEDFLDRLEIEKKYQVWYIQTEGTRETTVENMIKMMSEINFDLDNIAHTFAPSIPLDTREGLAKLLSIASKLPWKPSVIILDPLYMTISGDICSQPTSSAWVNNMRILKDTCNSAVICIHHVHRQRRTNDGKLIEEGDDNIYGSFVWKAFADHTVLLRRRSDGLHCLSCSTQRSGKVFREIELRMIEPQPLYFEVKGELPPSDIIIRNYIEKHQWCTREKIMSETKMSRSAITKSLRRLFAVGDIIKDDSGRPVKYSIKKEDGDVSWSIIPPSLIGDGQGLGGGKCGECEDKETGPAVPA